MSSFRPSVRLGSLPPIRHNRITARISVIWEGGAGLMLVLTGIWLDVPTLNKTILISIGLLGVAVVAWIFAFPHLLTERVMDAQIFSGALITAIATGAAKGHDIVPAYTVVLVLALLYASLFMPVRSALTHILVIVVISVVLFVYLDYSVLAIIEYAVIFLLIGVGNMVFARLVSEADLDPLTGIANRRAYEIGLGNFIGLAGPHHPLSAIIIDIDHFKQTNDIKGHDAGDELLIGCAQRWQQVVPKNCLLARLGGDEFTVALPEHTLEQAGHVAEEMRQGLPLSQTISVGVAQWRAGDSHSMLLKRADVALYKAKSTGRDKVEFFTDSDEEPELTH